MSKQAAIIKRAAFTLVVMLLAVALLQFMVGRTNIGRRLNQSRTNV